ncbi:MAG TPA: hypothetical protein VM120_16445 [Bryobacteraceae bacterium]|nr:hypothetical protein [Bryobacteraceae bacterium]
MFHGLKNVALPPGALNNTRQRLDGPLTLAAIPNAGTGSRWDAAETVTSHRKGRTK